MFDFHAQVGGVVALLFIVSWSLVCADDTFADIFGDDIDPAFAWTKLMELKNCPSPHVLPSTIIMVNESLTAGARFVNNTKVGSKYECEFECCRDADRAKEKHRDPCNVAVFAEEVGNCYLFACGTPSRCQFDSHEDYTVSLAIDTKPAAPVTTTKTKQPSTTTPSPVTTEAPPKSLSLLAGCREDVDTCEAKNSECRAGFCLCSEKFHLKNGVCRHDCMEGLQFECTNGDPKYAQPDCIAVYDVCDGFEQCPDGSDEKNCDTDDVSWLKNIGQEMKAEPAESMKDHVPQPTRATTTPAAAKPGSLPAELPTAKPTAVKPTAVKPAEASVSSEIEPLSNVTSEELIVNEAVLVPDSSGDDTGKANSAIIALSLSLTLTFLLVIYLGCRYRRMKTRLGRNGKPLRSSEIDYLIDGMYL